MKNTWIINNLRNTLMLGNSQKDYFEKSYYVSKYLLIFFFLLIFIKSPTSIAIG